MSRLLRPLNAHKLNFFRLSDFLLSLRGRFSVIKPDSFWVSIFSKASSSMISVSEFDSSSINDSESTDFPNKAGPRKILLSKGASSVGGSEQ